MSQPDLEVLFEHDAQEDDDDVTDDDKDSIVGDEWDSEEYEEEE